jgi:hypothetical protein
MKQIFILMTGQIKLPYLFNKIITEYNKINNIKIIFCTWKGQMKIYDKTINQINKKNIKLIISKELKDNGDGNIIAQAYQYRKGMEYIKNNTKDLNNTFILKTRPDVFIRANFFNEIINMNLKIDNGNSLEYKIWTGWTHAIKPFYLEDSYFYSHYNTMIKLLDFDKNIFKRENLGQGISHIRRFIIPFFNEYPDLFDYINNKNNFTKELEKKSIK